MMNPETRGMQLSIYGSLLMAALGLGFAIWTRSQAVLLDGAFNLVAVLMAAVALRITRLLRLPETDRLPVGYVAYEPFFVLLKGLLLLLLTLVVIASNIVIMINGGNTLEFGKIVFYVLIAVFLNLIIYLFIRKQSQSASSPILELERENWMVNTLISTAIGVSFVLVFFFEDSFLKPYVPYVDQVIVILVGLVSLPVPYRAIRQGLKELLLIAPDESIKAQVNAVIHRRLKDTSLIDWNAVVLKTGRKIWVTLFINPEKDMIPVDYGDEIRELVSPGIEELSSSFNVDVIVTRDV
jgi:predicted Co/Zn/Cd cation transporter (cation efflux family)